MNGDYTVRALELHELREALDLVWRVFLEFEAPDYTGEGVQEFRQFIVLDSIQQSIREGRYHMWVCHDQARIVGVLAVRPQCHISLLFVDGSCHRKGIARAMFSYMIEHFAQASGSPVVTVNSSPYAVEAYHRLGFQDTDVEQSVNGIRFVPMMRPI